MSCRMTTPDPGRTLKIIHPQTGEMIDLITAEDIELGQLLSEHYEIERVVRTNIRVIQGEIERRGREREIGRASCREREGVWGEVATAHTCRKAVTSRNR